MSPIGAIEKGATRGRLLLGDEAVGRTEVVTAPARPEEVPACTTAR